jgi:hypothetical protein
MDLKCAVHGETLRGKFYLISLRHNMSRLGPPPPIPICAQAYNGIPADARRMDDGSFDVHEAQASGDGGADVGEVVCMLDSDALVKHLNGVPHRRRDYW